MKFTLLIAGTVSEQIVAKFRTQSEAFHCGSLLQASTEDKTLIYYVEFKEKGTLTRKGVDSFTQRLPYLNAHTQQCIDNIYARNRN